MIQRKHSYYSIKETGIDSNGKERTYEIIISESEGEICSEEPVPLRPCTVEIINRGVDIFSSTLEDLCLRLVSQEAITSELVKAKLIIRELEQAITFLEDNQIREPIR